MTSADDLILTMKDTSEQMVDLAYTALFYDSRALAEEVQQMEEELDETLADLQHLILEAVRAGELDVEAAWVLLRVAQGAETIANSALEIADVVLRDMELHPVIQASIQESDTTVTKVRLDAASEFASKSLRELELEAETGMRIVAVKRGRHWQTKVTGDLVLEPDDVIVATGPWDAEEEFQERCAPE